MAKLQPEVKERFCLYTKTPNDTNDIPRFDDIKKVTLENFITGILSSRKRVNLVFNLLNMIKLIRGNTSKGLECYNLKGFDIKIC